MRQEWWKWMVDANLKQQFPNIGNLSGCHEYRLFKSCEKLSNKQIL
jgi:hypothetical protein